MKVERVIRNAAALVGPSACRCGAGVCCVDAQQLAPRDVTITAPAACTFDRATARLVEVAARLTHARQAGTAWDSEPHVQPLTAAGLPAASRAAWQARAATGGLADAVGIAGGLVIRERAIEVDIVGVAAAARTARSARHAAGVAEVCRGACAAVRVAARGVPVLGTIVGVTLFAAALAKVPAWRFCTLAKDSGQIYSTPFEVGGVTDSVARASIARVEMQ